MSHRILSAAALRSGVAAAAVTAPVTPAPAPAAPAAGGEGAVDVVTVEDARAEIAAAETKAHAAGATAERERTAAVFASAEGKAAPQMAVFMLSSNPGATADAIVAQLKNMPAAATTTTAPAAAKEPAPPAAITHDLNETPIVQPGVEANQGGGEGMTKEDQAKFWDTHIASASNAAHSPFGGELAPGLPRTGN